MTFTATVVSAGSNGPTGTVVFADGTTTIGSAKLSGAVAALTKSKLAPGSHSITAEYKGDDDSAPSTSQIVTQVVNSAADTTPATSASGSPAQGQISDSHAVPARLIEVSRLRPQPQVDSSCRTKTKAFAYGNTYVTQTVTVTAVVDMLENCDDQNFNPYFCQGTVNFYDYEDGNKTLLGAGSPVSGNNPCSRMFNINSLTAGTHVIDADFEGNPDYTRSSGRVAVEVDKWPTTTTVTSSPNPSTSGQDVTFTVTASGGIEDPQPGTVKISNGSIPLGTATLTGGVATFTAKKLAAGANPITAEFLGDSQSAKSTSTVLDQVVNPAAP